MAERFVVDGVEAVLMNAEEINASRLVLAGMTETRRYRYGIEKPHSYYAGSVVFRVQYRGQMLTSILKRAERHFCEVNVNPGVCDDSSSFDNKAHLKKLFFIEDEYGNRYSDHPKDYVLSIFDSKEAQVEIPDYLKRVIVTNMVQSYVKYHDDDGRFHDFESELSTLNSHLIAHYLKQNKYRIEAVDEYEREVVRDTRSKLRSGLVKQHEVHAMRKAAREAGFDIRRAINIEAKKYALVGCVYYCRENYGVGEDVFCEFVKRHVNRYILNLN